MTLLEGVRITRHVDVSFLLQKLSQFLQKLGRVITKHIRIRQVMAIMVINIASLYHHLPIGRMLRFPFSDEVLKLLQRSLFVLLVLFPLTGFHPV